VLSVFFPLGAGENWPRGFELVRPPIGLTKYSSSSLSIIRLNPPFFLLDSVLADAFPNCIAHKVSEARFPFSFIRVFLSFFFFFVFLACLPEFFVSIERESPPPLLGWNQILNAAPPQENPIPGPNPDSQAEDPQTKELSLFNKR